VTEQFTRSVFEVTVAVDPPLTGTLSAQVYEGKKLSNHVIRVDHDWTVRVHWELEGALVPCICGYWCLNLFMESIGPGDELRLPVKEARIPLDPCREEPGSYWYDITIPAHTIDPEYCGIPYKPVVALTYLDACYQPGPMAGFCELPILQFYEDKKQTPH